MRVAKERGIAVLLVGHVTKDGALAGPRVLEHLVDCVLQFEGERERTYRTLRALKNRFGSTNEVGRLRDARARARRGARTPPRASSSEATRAPGSVVLCAMEGSRPLLVEVQALVAPTELVPPRRVANGIDRNRLALVLAVLARHARLQLGSSDVFVSVAGGVRVDEPGADLAVALAIAERRARRAARRRRQRAARGVRRGRPDRRAALRRAPRAARAEARKFGLRSRRRAGRPARATLARRSRAARGADRARRRGRLSARRPKRPKALRCEGKKRQRIRLLCVECSAWQPHAGDEVSRARASPRAPARPGARDGRARTALREGIDNIVHARTGALIAIGDGDDLSFLYSGGIKLDIDYTPALLYQLAKMDGAIMLSATTRRRSAGPTSS